ncbi:MAG: carboxypeptidase-like regulatory domain-containing protein, partial [Flavobacteriaceae bacterium]
MQYKLAIVLLWCMASSSFAQIKLEGIVKDSIGNPLELSNVVAINQSTKNLDSYGISNDQGEYRLNLKENTSYTLQISYVGMITHHEVITTSENDMIKNFNLMPDNTLDQVELIYEMPVTINGDTLVYNADSFMDETDKKLEDVLKKLPGVDINDDGEIEVEGKVVDKVMVEGKDFFDGDTK